MKFYCNACETTFEDTEPQAQVAGGDGLVHVQCSRCQSQDVIATAALHNASDDDYNTWYGDDWGAEDEDDEDDGDNLDDGGYAAFLDGRSDSH